MSSVNYNLKHKGVRLISADDAWISNPKTHKRRLNPKYHFVGKMDISMPNMILTTSDTKKPSYKGSTYDLNRTAKKQIVAHFFDDKGKRTKRRVAYFGVEKETKKRGKNS